MRDIFSNPVENSFYIRIDNRNKDFEEKAFSRQNLLQNSAFKLIVKA